MSFTDFIQTNINSETYRVCWMKTPLLQAVLPPGKFGQACLGKNFLCLGLKDEQMQNCSDSFNLILCIAI